MDRGRGFREDRQGLRGGDAVLQIPGQTRYPRRVDRAWLLVLFAGCSGSGEPDLAGPRPAAAIPVRAAAGAVAVDDAPASGVAVDQRLAVDQRPAVDPSAGPGDRPDDAPASKPLVVPIDARIIDIKRSPDALTVTINRGGRHGITPAWRGEFLTAANRPGGVRFALTRITAHTCLAVVRLRELPSEHVRLYPAGMAGTAGTR